MGKRKRLERENQEGANVNSKLPPISKEI